jgi:hypothetical protein
MKITQISEIKETICLNVDGIIIGFQKEISSD